MDIQKTADCCHTALIVLGGFNHPIIKFHENTSKFEVLSLKKQQVNETETKIGCEFTAKIVFNPFFLGGMRPAQPSLKIPTIVLYQATYTFTSQSATTEKSSSISLPQTCTCGNSYVANRALSGNSFVWIRTLNLCIPDRPVHHYSGRVTFLQRN